MGPTRYADSAANCLGQVDRNVQQGHTGLPVVSITSHKRHELYYAENC